MQSQSNTAQKLTTGQERAAMRVARHMWRKAGCPEKDSEPTSVGFSYYEDRARDVVAGLLELGFAVTRPRAKSPAKFPAKG